MEAKQNCDIGIWFPLLYFHWFQSWVKLPAVTDEWKHCIAANEALFSGLMTSTSSAATVPAADTSCDMFLSTSNFRCMKHIYLFNYLMLRSIKVRLIPNTHNAIQRISLKSVYVHFKCRTTSEADWFIFSTQGRCVRLGCSPTCFKCTLTDLLTWSTRALGSTYSKGDIKLQCCSLLIILFCRLH